MQQNGRKSHPASLIVLLRLRRAGRDPASLATGTRRLPDARRTGPYATRVQTFQGLGATSLLILVGVAIQTAKQLQTAVISQRYEGMVRQ